jgi:hypothetical protein
MRNEVDQYEPKGEMPVQTTGIRWGDGISDERTATLEAMLREWEEIDHHGRAGPFDQLPLTGADVFWLVARARADSVGEVEEVKDQLCKMCDTSPEDAGFDFSTLPLEENIRRAKLVLSDFHHAVHLEEADLTGAHLERAYLVGAHLEGAVFHGAHLEGASLSGAHLEEARFMGAYLQGADLSTAHLERAHLDSVHLEEADFSRAFFDASTTLFNVRLGDIGRLQDISWGGVNLSLLVDWSHISILGDERAARQKQGKAGKKKSKAQRLEEYTDAARANRQLAITLRAQGMNTEADRFAYRGQVLHRQVLRRRGRLVATLGSWFLDCIAGYGYRPIRSFTTYALVILGFAVTFLVLGSANRQPLSWNEAIVISMTAFHGRGFFSAVFKPGDLQAAIAAVEAFIGLLIEIVLIATFTNRFFSR